MFKFCYLAFSIFILTACVQGVVSPGGGTISTNTTCTSNCDALPSAPNIGAATLLSGGFIQLSWNDGAQGKSVVSSYTITPYVGGVAQPARLYTVAQTALTGATRSVSNITGIPKTTYAFTVAATNEFGVGPASRLSNAVAIPDVMMACECDGGTCDITGQCQQPPGPNCKTDVWNNLEACGWPGPSNTGAPKNIQFKDMTDWEITVDGTVLDGVRMKQGVWVKAKNVVIRNSLITLENALGIPILLASGASLTLENSTIVSRKDEEMEYAILSQGDGSLIARNNDILSGGHGGLNLQYSTSILFENNYLHDFNYSNVVSYDVDCYFLLAGSNITIRHNTLDFARNSPETESSFVVDGSANSKIRHVLVENNLVAPKGDKRSRPVRAYPAVTEDVQFINNRFSLRNFECVNGVQFWMVSNDTVTRKGNVVIETGENIDNKDPTLGGPKCL